MKQITVQASIVGDLKKIWDYYTLPQHIIKWNFAADDWCCPKAKNDLKVGGKYTARMEAKDGSFGFDFECVYDEVVIQERIAYTIADGRKASVDFDHKKGKTTVIVQFEAEEQNSPEMQQKGWQAILDNFKKYVEAN